MSTEHLSRELLSVADEYGIDLKALSSVEATKLYSEVRHLYCDGHRCGTPLWESMTSCESIFDPNAWARVDELFDDERLTMLLEGEPVRAFEFTSGVDIKKLLSHCTAFEFYITNAKKSSLIVFNDHDMLVICGRAKNRGYVPRTDNVADQ